MHPVIKDELPIYSMLETFSKTERVSFHMPGHNRGVAFPDEILSNLISLDNTELSGTGNLNLPSGNIEKAYNLAARDFGSLFTFFITTGSTLSIHTVLHALTEVKNKVIAADGCHQSVFNACSMMKLKLIIIPAEKLEETLENNPDSAVVIVTSPDYFGKCANVKKISSISHKYNVPVLTDESHGSHFVFCRDLLPLPALLQGSDIVVHSAHKTIPALTQGSYLHVSKTNILESDIYEKITDAISCVNTSSPSYVIAASLDYARFYMAKYGYDKIHEVYKNTRFFLDNLNPEWLKTISGDYLDFINSGFRNYVPDFDFTRFVMDVSAIGLEAFLVSEELESKGIFIELYDLSKIVFIFKTENTLSDFRYLCEALNSIYDKLHSSTSGMNDSAKQNKLINDISVMTVKCSRKESIQADFSKLRRKSSEYVLLEKSIHRAVAAFVIPFPPGTPLLIPGEKVTGEIIEIINAYVSYGITLYGVRVSGKNKLIKCFV